MKNRMTMNQLSTYLPFWEEMEKRLSKSIERKDLAEVQSILNRAYMKALEVGFEEGVKNMYSAQDMEAFCCGQTTTDGSMENLPRCGIITPK